MGKCWTSIAAVWVLTAGVMSTMARAESHLTAAVGLECDAAVRPLAIEENAPELEWRVTAGEDLRGVRQSAYRVLVASSQHILDDNRGDMWDTGQVSSNTTFGIAYHGKPLTAEKTYFWKVMVWDENGVAAPWSNIASWTMAPTAWTAHWIAQAGTTNETPQMPVFRHEFVVKKKLVQAVMEVSALGQGEVHLNGMKVGDAELAPGWTDYRKTVRYDAFDVTDMLHQGRNAVGVLLGNGMFNIVKTSHRYLKLTNSFGKPMVFLQMRLMYADGTSEIVATDSSWLAAPGPITFSSTYGGEDYDATKEIAGWDEVGSPSPQWAAVQELNGPGGKLHPEVAPPIRTMHVYEPTKVTQVAPGVTVYDLGQNFAGWPNVRVRGTAGAILKLTPGELLNPDGTVSQMSSKGPQWFSYTVRGDHKIEEWHPRFSYYGFRYVQAEWISGTGEILSLQGDAVHSSSPVTGEFVSSNSMLNAIHKLIVEAMHNNEVSLFTDCPHREKLGWLEETHLVAPGLIFNNNLRGLYRATEENIADDQKSDGMVPTIAPEYTVFAKQGYGIFDDSPEWGSASMLAAWDAYRAYGDVRELVQYYPVMQRYVDYLKGKAQNGIVAYGLGDWYDIGPGDPGVSKNTSLGVTGTLMLYQDARTMEQIASVLEKFDDARKYADLAARTASAFNTKFFNPSTGQYDRGSQTANAMPLNLGLVSEDRRSDVLSHLTSDIHAHGDHVTTGEIGYPYLLRALMLNDENDLLMTMMTRKDPPSYGAQLAAGATSLTEAWDADPHSSLDHFMLGGAEEWFDRGLGGIDFDMSREKDEWITIHPHMVTGVDWVVCSYESQIGMIKSSWKRESGVTTMSVTIPANASATVWVPVRSNEEVAADKAAVKTRETPTAISYHIVSGTYQFVIRSK